MLAAPTPDDLQTYDATFAARNTGGFVDGVAAREVFLRSQLPTETLSLIWRLADMDGDARLSHHEFRVAMHLVMQTFRHGVPVPSAVPPSVLLALNPQPQAAADMQQPSATEDWTLPADAAARYADAFRTASQQCGMPTLGKVESGLSAWGLPTEVLLRLWSIADTDGDDRLNLREYVLCSFLVQRYASTQQLPPAALPPTLLIAVNAAAEAHSAPAPMPAPAPVPAPAPAPAPTASFDTGSGFGASFDGGGFGTNFGGASGFDGGASFAAFEPPAPAAAEPAPAPSTAADDHNELVAALVEMGFDAATASAALHQANGDVSQAANLLVSGQVQQPQAQPQTQPRSQLPAEGFGASFGDSFGASFGTTTTPAPAPAPAFSSTTGFGEAPAFGGTAGFGETAAPAFNSAGFGEAPAFSGAGGFGEMPAPAPAFNTAAGFGEAPAFGGAGGFGEMPAPAPAPALSGTAGFGEPPSDMFSSLGAPNRTSAFLSSNAASRHSSISGEASGPDAFADAFSRASSRRPSIAASPAVSRDASFPDFAAGMAAAPTAASSFASTPPSLPPSCAYGMGLDSSAPPLPPPTLSAADFGGGGLGTEFGGGSAEAPFPEMAAAPAAPAANMSDSPFGEAFGVEDFGGCGMSTAPAAPTVDQFMMSVQQQEWAAPLPPTAPTADQFIASVVNETVTPGSRSGEGADLFADAFNRPPSRRPSLASLMQPAALSRKPSLDPMGPDTSAGLMAYAAPSGPSLVVLAKGAVVWYENSQRGERQQATVEAVHHDDQPPYYTIRFATGETRETTRDHLHDDAGPATTPSDAALGGQGTASSAPLPAAGFGGLEASAACAEPVTSGIGMGMLSTGDFGGGMAMPSPAQHPSEPSGATAPAASASVAASPVVSGSGTPACFGQDFGSSFSLGLGAPAAPAASTSAPPIAVEGYGGAFLSSQGDALQSSAVGADAIGSGFCAPADTVSAPAAAALTTTTPSLPPSCAYGMGLDSSAPPLPPPTLSAADFGGGGLGTEFGGGFGGAGAPSGMAAPAEAPAAPAPDWFAEPAGPSDSSAAKESSSETAPGGDGSFAASPAVAPGMAFGGEVASFGAAAPEAAPSTGAADWFACSSAAPIETSAVAAALAAPPAGDVTASRKPSFGFGSLDFGDGFGGGAVPVSAAPVNAPTAGVPIEVAAPAVEPASDASAAFEMPAAPSIADQPIAVPPASEDISRSEATRKASFGLGNMDWGDGGFGAGSFGAAPVAADDAAIPASAAGVPDSFAAPAAAEGGTAGDPASRKASFGFGGLDFGGGYGGSALDGQAPPTDVGASITPVAALPAAPPQVDATAAPSAAFAPPACSALDMAMFSSAPPAEPSPPTSTLPPFVPATSTEPEPTAFGLGSGFGPASTDAMPSLSFGATAWAPSAVGGIAAAASSGPSDAERARYEMLFAALASNDGGGAPRCVEPSAVVALLLMQLPAAPPLELAPFCGLMHRMARLLRPAPGGAPLTAAELEALAAARAGEAGDAVGPLSPPRQPAAQEGDKDEDDEEEERQGSYHRTRRLSAAQKRLEEQLRGRDEAAELSAQLSEGQRRLEEQVRRLVEENESAQRQAQMQAERRAADEERREEERREREAEEGREREARQRELVREAEWARREAELRAEREAAERARWEAEARAVRRETDERAARAEERARDLEAAAAAATAAAAAAAAAVTDAAGRERAASAPLGAELPALAPLPAAPSATPPPLLEPVARRASSDSSSAAPPPPQQPWSGEVATPNPFVASPQLPRFNDAFAPRSRSPTTRDRSVSRSNPFGTTPQPPPQPAAPTTGAAPGPTPKPKRPPLPPTSRRSPAVLQPPSEAHRQKYAQIYAVLQTAAAPGRHLSKRKAMSCLKKSGLPEPMLEQVWHLSDVDGDGMAREEEFVLAMHLANWCVKSGAIPDKLPAALVPKTSVDR